MVEKSFLSKLKERVCCSVAKNKNNVIRIKVSIPKIKVQYWKVTEVLIPSYSITLTGKNLTRAQSKCL